MIRPCFPLSEFLPLFDSEKAPGMRTLSRACHPMTTKKNKNRATVRPT